MKNTLHLLFTTLLSFGLMAQDVKPQKLTSKIKSVRVYMQGAEITREVSVPLVKGKNELVFDKLSPSIETQSIRLNGSGVTILSVKGQYDYVTTETPEKEAEVLESQIKAVQLQISQVKMTLQDIEDERAILLKNQSIGGDQGINPATLKMAMDFFKERMKSISQATFEQKQTLAALEEKTSLLNNQLNELGGAETEKYGQVNAVVSSESAKTVMMQVKYLVRNAQWMPSYDIRFASVDMPLGLSYKAHVKQNTGIDWKGVQLSISSGNPEESGNAPSLNPWYLGFGSAYRPSASPVESNRIEGVVMDEDGVALPGANVMIKGSTIGTVTDIDGRYSLQIPNESAVLSFSFVGFSNVERTVRGGQRVNVALNSDDSILEEVVVTGYGEQLSGRAAGVSISKAKKAREREERMKMEKRAMIRPTSEVLPVEAMEYQTVFAYNIKVPYDIPSDNKPYAVEMVRHEIPATYRYQTTPKLMETAFLTAELLDWGKYNLLEAEANLFIENDFVGKTLLTLEEAGDTLQLSLGRDERIGIQRSKAKDFEEKRFIGSKRKETKAWTITLRNTKKEEVEVWVTDQVPVSSNEQIKITAEKLDGAIYNEQTGMLLWKVKIKPNSSKEITFKYMVEYPSDQTVYLE